MNESKHTPGPWSFEGPEHSIIVYGPEPEQRVCFMTSDGPTAANARLIAAVPDMLEGAKALITSLRSFSDAPSHDLEDQRWHFEVLPAMRTLESAIAKAEGR